MDSTSVIRYDTLGEMDRFELEILVKWFTHNMSTDTRRQLMEQFPQACKGLYPSADNDAIISHVSAGLRSQF